MKLSITVFAATLITFLGVAAAPAAAESPYRVYGSCAPHKPFRPARHCGFNSPDSVRATFVFESHVGNRKLKVCEKVFGVPLNGRHYCVTGRGFTIYEAVPFHFTGIHVPIRAQVKFFARKPGASHYKRAGTATLRFDP